MCISGWSCNTADGRYTLLLCRRNDELIHYAKEEGIAVTAYSPIGSEPPEGNKSPLDDSTIKKVPTSHMCSCTADLRQVCCESRVDPMVVLPKGHNLSVLASFEGGLLYILRICAM